MLIKKLFLLLSVALVIPVCVAQDDSNLIRIPTKQIQLTGDNLRKKFDEIIMDKEALLKKFKIVGAKEIVRKVEGNMLYSQVSVNILFKSKKINIGGELDIFDDNTSCSKNEAGYKVLFDLSKSSPGLYKNINQVQSDICINYLSFNKAVLRISTAVKKGNDYSSAYGFLLKNAVVDQVESMIQTVREEVKK